MRTTDVLLPLAAVVLCSASPAAGTTYVVSPDGTGDFPTIQAALDAVVDGDVIELTDGIFQGSGNKNLDFRGKAVTLRSQSDQPEQCVVDCEEDGRGMVFQSGEGPSAVVEAISFVKGAYSSGGGFACRNLSSPTVNRCLFMNNEVEGGGGAVSCYRAGAFITDCTFSENAAPSYEGGGDGGAITCTEGELVLVNCMFEYNEARGVFDGGFGGALYCVNSTVTMDNCRFAGNYATRGGAAIYCYDCAAVLSGCAFLHNAASLIGAVYLSYCRPPLEVSDCWFEANHVANGRGAALAITECSPLVVSCSFVSNEAPWGAGIDCLEASPTLIGCTFYANAALSGGAGIWGREASFPVLENTIISFSTAGEAILCDEASGATLACCDVYGNAGGDWTGCIEGQSGVSGNICEHPLFCGPEVGDFTLAENSPCAPFTPPNPECDLIGAWPVGCGPAWVPDEPPPPGQADFRVTWGALKSVFRR